MRELGDHCVETGVDIRKGYEDPVEAIVADGNGRWTSGVGRTTCHTICAGALHTIPISVEGVSRLEAVEIDGASKLAASAPLVADCGLPIVDGFELRL